MVGSVSSASVLPPADRDLLGTSHPEVDLDELDGLVSATYRARAWPEVECMVSYARCLAATIVSPPIASRASHWRALAIRSKAFHLICFTLSSKIPPDELTRLMAPALAAMHRHLEAGRGEVLSDDETAAMRMTNAMFGLSVRTVSTLSSKRDLYWQAYTEIVLSLRSLRQLEGIGGAGGVAREARQQAYLQECGQHSRDVEVALTEVSASRRNAMLQGDLSHAAYRPGRSIKTMYDDHQLWVVQIARASVDAGAEAVRLTELMEDEGRLVPAEYLSFDKGFDRLASMNWSVTVRVMYIRALLLYAIISLAIDRHHVPALRTDKDHPARMLTIDEFLAEVPTRFSEVLNAPVVLNKNNKMDMARNLLQWAFLHQGQHPNALLGVPHDRDVPSFLRPVVNGGRIGMVDVQACSTALIKNKHNAGILDILAFSEVFDLFVRRAGSAGFHDWVVTHRQNQDALGLYSVRHVANLTLPEMALTARDLNRREIGTRFANPAPKLGRH